MYPRQLLLAALAAILSSLIMGASAHAQATRTWVSGVGDDANPCSLTAPCKTFAGAIGKTNAGGEINCLNSAGYGAVTITKSITIDCTGVFASVLNTGVNGIVINDGATGTPGTIIVTLRNISFNASPSVPGTNGIRVLAAKAVYVSNVFIQGQNATAPNGCGVSIASTTAVRVYLRNVELTRNRVGACVTANSGIQNSIFIEDSTFESNTDNTLVLTGANAGAGATGSVFAPNGMILSGGATFASTGNNRIAGAVGPTSTLPLQ